MNKSETEMKNKNHSTETTKEERDVVKKGDGVDLKEEEEEKKFERGSEKEEALAMDRIRRALEKKDWKKAEKLFYDMLRLKRRNYYGAKGYDSNINACLMYASLLGYVDVVKVLVQNGADVNANEIASRWKTHEA